MYTDIQEPMLNAAQEQIGSNPFTALINNSNNSSTSGKNHPRLHFLLVLWFLVPRATQFASFPKFLQPPSCNEECRTQIRYRIRGPRAMPRRGREIRLQILLRPTLHGPGVTSHQIRQVVILRTAFLTLPECRAWCSRSAKIRSSCRTWWMLRIPEACLKLWVRIPILRSRYAVLFLPFSFFWGTISSSVLRFQVIGANPIFAGNPELQERMRTMLPTMLQQVCEHCKNRLNPSQRSFTGSLVSDWIT